MTVALLDKSSPTSYPLTLDKQLVLFLHLQKGFELGRLVLLRSGDQQRHRVGDHVVVLDLEINVLAGGRADIDPARGDHDGGIAERATEIGEGCGDPLHRRLLVVIFRNIHNKVGASPERRLIYNF